MSTKSLAAQRAADVKRLSRLHHLRRLAWLSGPSPAWSCGTPVAPSDVQSLSRQSKLALTDPAVPCTGGPAPGTPEADELEAWAVDNKVSP